MVVLYIGGGGVDAMVVHYSGGFYPRPPRYCSSSPSVIRHNLSSRHHRYTPSRPLSQYLTCICPRCKMYLYEFQNVFVQIEKHICHHRHTPSRPLSQYLTSLLILYSLTEELVDRHCAPPLLQKDAWAQAAHQETVRESLSKKSKQVKKS